MENTTESKKARRKMMQRKWLDANRERVNARKRELRHNDLENRREKEREYRKRTKDRQNEIQRRYRKRHPEKAKELNRSNYIRNKEKRLAYSAEYRKKNSERIKLWQRWYREKIKSSPELSAKYSTYYAKRYAENKESINKASREWKRKHKGKVKRMSRWYNDRIRALCSQDPFFYAMIRARSRRYYLKKRKKLGIKSEYRPMPSRRIPDYCAYDRVLDKRSVFLWNNRPAASIIAGRAYKQMQWRESHCDRFGQVCR